MIQEKELKKGIQYLHLTIYLTHLNKHQILFKDKIINNMTIKTIPFLSRMILGLLLIVSIWIRVDWTVAIFALLVLIRAEAEDYYL